MMWQIKGEGEECLQAPGKVHLNRLVSAVVTFYPLNFAIAETFIRLHSDKPDNLYS